LFRTVSNLNGLLAHPSITWKCTMRRKAFLRRRMIGAEGMLLMCDHGIFYEFIPAEEFGKSHPQTVQLNEVELGKTMHR
jgi:trehalose-6-phosphatase